MICDLCKCEVIQDDYDYDGDDYCSEFCVTTTPEEKAAYLKLQPGEVGIWPCSECHNAIEDDYNPGGCCSRCHPKVELRKAEKRIAELEQERDLYKIECQKAYDFNRQINKDWQFKLERLKLEMQHYVDVRRDVVIQDYVPVIPIGKKYQISWKKIAKVFFARLRILGALHEQEIQHLHEGIRDHRDQKGHDRCWLDDDKLYQLLPEGPENYNSSLPSREEFLGNCVRFFETRQGPCPKLHEWGESAFEKQRSAARRWKHLAKRLRVRLENQTYFSNCEINRLRELLNNPLTNEFFEAVKIEVAHQKERWVNTDSVKTDADWFWLIGYLAGKAMWNPGDDSSKEKRLHRIITVAAAAYNWWESHQ